jgi:hypothetical protein
MHVEERFLLDGVGLNSLYIPPGRVELPVPVKTNLANSGLALENRALVTAGITSDAPMIQRLPQLAYPSVSGKDL